MIPAPHFTRQEAFVWIAHAHLAMARIYNFPEELLAEPAKDIGEMLLSGVPLKTMRESFRGAAKTILRHDVGPRKLCLFVRRVLRHTYDHGPYCAGSA